MKSAFFFARWFEKEKPLYTLEQAKIDFSEEWFTSRFYAPKAVAIELGNIRVIIRKSIDKEGVSLTLDINDFSHINQWIEHPETAYKQYVDMGCSYQSDYIGF